MWSILSPRGKDSHYEDAVELPEGVKTACDVELAAPKTRRVAGE